jgi:hypothetical protein
MSKVREGAGQNRMMGPQSQALRRGEGLTLMVSAKKKIPVQCGDKTNTPRLQQRKILMVSGKKKIAIFYAGS